MVLKTMVLTGAALAALTAGFTTSAFAAPQAAPNAAAERAMAGFQAGNDSDDVAGLNDESPVCSALGAETIPTGKVVARCLVGTTVV